MTFSISTIALAVILLSYCEAFCCTGGISVSACVKSSVSLFANDSSDIQQEEDSHIFQDESRRILLQSAVLSSAVWLLSPSSSFAVDDAIGASPNSPVAILGAGGKTGMEVAQALADQSLHCVTMSRSGRDPFQGAKLKPEIQEFIRHYETGVNVIEKEGMEEALKNVKASAIIYCATASRQGGTAFQVDDEGVGNAAQAALNLNARLILVSALAVDRPNSKSYQITNTLGGKYQGIMDAKLEGEEQVRKILSRKKDYVIVRPGVLLNGVSRNGALDMEINQGDTIGGGLSRDELAGVVVGALTSGKKGVTVEVYRRSTATPLQPSFSIPSGYEATSTTYGGLFESAVPDSKLRVDST